MGVWIHTSHVIINVAIPIKILNTETLIKQFWLWGFSLHMWLSICKMLYAIFIYFYINLLCLFGEGNGNPLQCSWLEKPRDGGAWWAAVYGVTESRTRLKQLSSIMFVGYSIVCNSKRNQTTQWPPKREGLNKLWYSHIMDNMWLKTNVHLTALIWKVLQDKL